VELYFHSPDTPSWSGAQLKAQGQLYLTFTKYFQSEQIKHNSMTDICSMHEVYKNVYIILFGKSEGKKSL